MRIDEVEEIMEAKMVWAKRGNKIVRKVRCTSGPRKGRLVSTSSQCSKAINLKKRFFLKGGLDLQWNLLLLLGEESPK